MRVPAGFAAAAAATLWLGGCAYVGDPLPPLVNIPQPVHDLAAVERASRIIVHFTPPAVTTEGVPVRQPLKFDLRVGTGSEGGGFDRDQWAAAAKPIPGGTLEQGIVTFLVPTAEWIGKTITIGVRTLPARGKASDWSNLVNLTVVPPPQTPRGLKLQATAQGVRLTWEGPPGTFRVYRRRADQKDFVPVADVTALEWTDPDAVFGDRYFYVVQRIVKPDEHPAAESDPSDPAEITPKDEFPPAAPTGLRATAAPSSIELSWDRNSEPDVAGYRVYRSVDGGAFEKVADVSQIPAWSDQKTEPGKTYRYAVSAIDQAGNESPRSPIAESTR